MEKSYSNCQSCGMPLKRDPNHGGTNADGTRSKMYCSYCFKDGKYIEADMRVDEMQAFVKNKMKNMGFPGFLAGWMTKGIPKLERWRTSTTS
jgi:hypothetical protein